MKITVIDGTESGPKRIISVVVDVKDNNFPQLNARVIRKINSPRAKKTLSR